MSQQRVVNPLPPAALGLAAVLFGLEVMFSLAEQGLLGGPGGIGWRAHAVQTYGFYGQALDWMLVNRQFPPDLLVRFVTYPLLSLSFSQAMFAAVFVLAMGKMVGEALGNIAVLVLFFGASIGAALVYGLALNDTFPLVGGFPGVYGLIGGYTFLLWIRSRLMQQNQLMAFRLIGLLLGIQLLFGLMFGTNYGWVADLAGFATGFGLSFLLVPGGLKKLREALRGR